MVTDIVGSTRLRAAVGDDEATRLIVVVSTIVDNAVTAHDGVVRRGTGDGARSTFTSVRAALRAAAAIQGLLARQPLRATTGLPVQLRIGICVGEVDINDAGAISGGPVRGADRVTDESPVGGIGLCPIAATMTDDNAGLELVAVTDRAVLLRPHLTPPHVTLPGRGDELGALHVALDRLAQHQGGMVLVSGDTGSGRSRLLDETARRASELGLRTLHHRCRPGQSPHAALVGLLEDAMGKVDAATIRHAAGNDARVLAAILPELARVLADEGTVPVPAGHMDDRLVERALTRFLFRAASSRPMLLIMDDFDDADAASREIICRLAPRLQDLGVLALASLHSSTTSGSQATWRTLVGLVRAGQADSVSLEPLRDDQLRQLLTHVLGASPTALELQGVARRTGGNVALVCALAAAARAQDTNIAIVSMPGAARIPLRDTVDHLGPAGRELLQLLALLGRPTSMGLLVALADRPEDEILAAMEHAEQLAVLSVEEDDGDYLVWFCQDLVRELILDETGGSTRSRISRRAAELNVDAA